MNKRTDRIISEFATSCARIIVDARIREHMATFDAKEAGALHFRVWDDAVAMSATVRNVPAGSALGIGAAEYDLLPGDRDALALALGRQTTLADRVACERAIRKELARLLDGIDSANMYDAKSFSFRSVIVRSLYERVAHAGMVTPQPYRNLDARVIPHEEQLRAERLYRERCAEQQSTRSRAAS